MGWPLSSRHRSTSNLAAKKAPRAAPTIASVYPQGSVGHALQLLSGLFFVGLFIASAYAVFRAEGAPNIRPRAIFLLSFCWAFFPPVWFWFEAFVVFPRWAVGGTSEVLKDGQRLSLAVWAPLSIALAAYGSSDYFKTKPAAPAAPIEKCAVRSPLTRSLGGFDG